ncbi:hypothetical protein [Bradyrhizobium sp. SZCCHNPS1003]|uniref:hypothetical protein n=1 Tax=unclassified Bradyrhizobium TaxID=2631580 RepID=UPI0028E9B4FC|nr:hypothetical protein [Bradyrhizobium sp. SZCCHNPS1003]
MSIKLNIDSTTKKYTDGVVGRIEHHAKEVEAAFAAIMGFVLVYSDSGSMAVREGRVQEIGNMGWAEFGGRRVAFRYEHATRKIEVRDGSVQGPMLADFDNNTELTALLDFFKNL